MQAIISVLISCGLFRFCHAVIMPASIFNDNNCMSDLFGTTYKGTINSTINGLTCQQWSADTPHNHSDTWVGDHNYCRNPSTDNGGPWCYTTDANTLRDFCNVPLCVGSPFEERKYCPSAKCVNNGTLILQSCTCRCPAMFTGIFCETEIKSTQWPEGTYALHSSMFGCPESSEFGWSTGYINLTLFDNSRNFIWNDDDPYTFEPHILGPYTEHAMQMNFCVMESNVTVFDDDSRVNRTWPTGNYCIYRTGVKCPVGFDEGSLTIRGYNYSLGGKLPYIKLDSSSDFALVYCCREDGNVNQSVHLPSEFPFILYLGSSSIKCQEIDKMDWKLDEFYLPYDNSSMMDGLLPNFQSPPMHTSHIGLPLCYYQPRGKRECMYTTDNGASYNGHLNISKYRKPCDLWTDVNLDLATSTRWVGEFENNFCRKTRWEPPGCYFNNKRANCNIPVCEKDNLKVFGKKRSYNAAQQNAGSPPSNALDGLTSVGTSYVSERPSSKPWFLLNLEEYIEVHAIVLYRQKVWFPVNNRYIGTYVSKHRWDFLTYGAYRCDDNRNPWKHKIFRFQCKRPIIGQYVSVKNFDFTEPDRKHGYFHYLEIDEIQVVGRPRMCGRRLGLITGDVYDYQIESSSLKDNDHQFAFGRLFRPENGWCARSTDNTPWFMVDLLVPLKVQGVELQGIKDGQNVKLINSFNILYGIDRNNLAIYQDPMGTMKVFKTDPSIGVSIQQFIFTTEIYSRYIKVVPLEYTDACLKLEIIGCSKQAIRDLWCRNYKYDLGFEVLPYHAFWMIEDHDAIRMIKTDVDIQQCIGHCQNITCLSFSFDYHERYCVLHMGHKYTRQFQKWWVNKVDVSNIYYQRLCFKEFLEVNECGSKIFLKDENTTTIVSPSFPLNYGQGINCVWSIQSEMYVEIEFVYIKLQEKILVNDLQKMGVYDINPGECEDTLSIRDKSGYTKNILPSDKKLDGVKLISVSNKMTIQLSTCFHYERNDAKAFELKVSMIDLPACGGIDSCFQTCTQQSAYIFTPGFPIGYEPGDTCFWKIEGTYGQYVTFYIINLDVNDDSSCEKSFISVDDIDLLGRSKNLGKFCKGSRPYSVLTSSWEKLYIEFKAATDHDLQGNGGFLGKYEFKSFIQETFDLGNNSCKENWYGFKNSCYGMQRKTFGLTWIAAESECQVEGGHLVSIADQSEMEFIHYLVTILSNDPNENRAYIGLKKKTNGYSIKDYIWSDGKPMTFTSWYYDPTSELQQPDGLENEKCSILQLFSIHNMNDWHDVACAYDKISNFICEISQDFQIHDDIRNTWSHVTTQQTDALYMCKSGEYILNAFLCDSVEDCISGDDERNCSSIDTEDQFTCDDGSRISISLYCDFILHCKDGSDENSCERRACLPDEWQCTNRQCIANQQRCDFVENCLDKSDELECETCRFESFQCYDQQCIPSTRVCDGMIDCSGLFHEDESEDCQQKRQHTCKDWWASGAKRNGEYLIDLYLNKSALVECIFQESKDQIHVTTFVHHDNEEIITAITDGFDIRPKYFASDAHIVMLKQMEKCQQAIEVNCHFSQNRIYRSSLDGREIHNKQHQGNCGCPFVDNCNSDINKCNCGTEPYDWYSADDNEIRSDIGVLTNNKDLPVKRIRTIWTAGVDTFVKIHLGPLKCEEDISIVSTVYLCRRGQSVSSHVLCLLDYDDKGELIGCRDLSHLSNCEQFLCPPGYFKCKNSYCIPPKLLCNGIHDCPLGEDEFNCSKPLCSGLFRCHSSNLCLNPDKRCNGFAECPQFDDELLCHIACTGTCKCHGLSRKCIFENISEISFLSEIRKIDLSLSNLSSSSLKLKENVLLAELNVSRTELHNLERLEFGESHNLFLLDISFNQLTAIPKNIFRGLTHLKSLLLLGNHFLENIYPKSFSGLHSLPMISLRENNIYLLTENTFIGLTKLKLLNLTDNKIKMVEDRSFASLKNLEILDIRRNKINIFQKNIFEGLTNLKELYSDAFVFCCLRPDSVREADCVPERDEFSSCSDMMRNDILRTCLWIIGVCGLFGNLIVLAYRIFYDRKSLSKSYGIFITSLGTSDCLMGIYMLTIASADVMFRGNYVWNDLSWRYGVACKIAGILSTVSNESSVVFLFLITIDRFIAIKYPFGEIRFGKKSAIRISFVVFVTSFILAVIPLLPGSYFDGNFYSRSAVCLALPLTRDKPNGWEYSFGIFIVFNFILFVIIAVTQLVIYKEVTNPIHIRSTKKNQDLTIARKLFLVVFSDFLCWFPVGVMGLMALRGHSIPAEVYAWTAVFILPINSALNPFLYTFASIRGNMRLQQKRAYQAGSTTSKRSNVSWCNAQGKNKGVYDTHDDGMVDNIEKMVKELLHENKIKEDDVEYMINKLTNTIDNNSITGEKFSTVCKRIPSIQTKRQNNDEDDIRY